LSLQAFSATYGFTCPTVVSVNCTRASPPLYVPVPAEAMPTTLIEPGYPYLPRLLAIWTNDAPVPSIPQATFGSPLPFVVVPHPF
jgi:hypothetical protein